ncbi:hypothetical protein QQ054_32220 [Oscillatoria amoena NRMC-F 0135]|nr:hypothetical protein [Oscillatoria amoena NRMC-F 0135]
MVRDAYAEITKQLRNKVRAQVMEEEITDIERRMKDIKKRFAQMGVEMLEETSLDGKISFGLPTQNENGLNVFYTDEDLEKLNQYNSLLAEQEKLLSDLTQIEIKKPAKEDSEKNMSGNELTESEEKKAEKLYQKINKLAEDSRLLLEKKDEQSEDRVKLKYSRLETEALKYYDKSHKIFALLEEAQQNELAKVRNDAWDKELAELDKEFQEKLKAIDKNYEDIKKLRHGLGDSIAKNAADEASAQAEMLQKVVSDEKNSVSVRRDALLKLHKAELFEIAERKRAEREAYEEQLGNVSLTEAERAELAEKITQLETDSLSQNLLIHEKYYDAVAQLEEDSFNKKLDGLNNYSSKLMGIYNTLNNVTVNQEQSRIDSLNREYENELQKLEEQNNSKLISDEAYKNKKKQLDDKYRKEEGKIKAQQFERQKTADLIQAGINTAVSITKAFATFGWPAGILPAGFALAEGLAQQAAISSKKAPEFGTGADLRGVGKKHSEGGIIAELERDEVVLSAKTVANNEPIVNALLDASLNKGGAKVDLPSNPILDFTPYFTAKKLLFASGGRVGSQVSTSTINNHYTSPTQVPSELMDLMVELNGAVSILNTTLKNGINAVYDDDELLFLRRRLSQLERLEGLNNIKKS